MHLGDEGVMTPYFHVQPLHANCPNSSSGTWWLCSPSHCLHEVLNHPAARDMPPAAPLLTPSAPRIASTSSRLA